MFVPHNLQNKLFAARVCILIEQSVVGLQAKFVKQILNCERIQIRHRTIFAIRARAVFAIGIQAQLIFEFKLIGLLIGAKVHICRLYCLRLKNVRETHLKGFFVRERHELLR